MPAGREDAGDDRAVRQLLATPAILISPSNVVNACSSNVCTRSSSKSHCNAGQQPEALSCSRKTSLFQLLTRAITANNASLLSSLKRTASGRRLAARCNTAKLAGAGPDTVQCLRWNRGWMPSWLSTVGASRTKHTRCCRRSNTFSHFTIM
jgi:hypothetical protein